MDHIRILRRAWDITRSYRTLWIFGILLALTTARGGAPPGGGGGGGGNNGSGGDIPFPHDLPDFTVPQIPQQTLDQILAAGIALACLTLLLIVVATIVQYVARTAAIRMVDRNEATGERVTFRQGWRLGWSRAAFRMWLVDLLFGLGFFIAFILLGLIALAPLLLWATQNEAAGLIGTFSTVGLGMLVILLFIGLVAALSLLSQFFHRALALEEMGVMDAIRRGWNIVRRRPGDVILMGLILFGFSLLLSIILIPIVFLLVMVGLVAGGLPALLVGALTNLFVHGSVPQMTALAVGIPIFIVVIAVPMLLIGGLVEAFTSSTWTLTYREMLALETVQPDTAA
jgi:hypothetical protein